MALGPPINPTTTVAIIVIRPAGISSRSDAGSRNVNATVIFRFGSSLPKPFNRIELAVNLRNHALRVFINAENQHS